MTVRVRPLEQRDHADWLALFRDYIAFYRADVPDEVVALTWSRLMGLEPEMLGLAAVGEDDRPVGLALIVFHRSTWSPTFYCYLEDLYVAPAMRGQGIGRALVEAVYAAADARGATRTYWVTESGNLTAQSLYDRLATRAPYVQYRR
ncbi:MAG: N-acetyltransferase family protein [Hyphomicrobiaceae bacterium]